MIEVSETANNSPNTATLIAGVSVAKAELVQGRTYLLETFKDKVGGFITFGSGSEENFSGKFSSPEQTLLTARGSSINPAAAYSGYADRTVRYPVDGAYKP